MITVNKGEISYSGNKVLLLSEVTTLLHAFIGEGVFDNDDIKEIVILATLSEDELKDELKNVDQFVKALLEAIHKMNDDEV